MLADGECVKVLLLAALPHPLQNIIWVARPEFGKLQEACIHQWQVFLLISVGRHQCPLSIELRGYSTSDHQFISFSSCVLGALGTHPHQRWVTSWWLTTFIKGWYSIKLSTYSTSNHSFMRKELHQVVEEGHSQQREDFQKKIRSTYDGIFRWQSRPNFWVLTVQHSWVFLFFSKSKIVS